MFEWDEEKSLRNLAERGFDFEFTCRIFEGDIIEQEDTRRDHGERRVIALGEVEGDVFAVSIPGAKDGAVSYRRVSQAGENAMSTVVRSAKEISKRKGKVDRDRLRRTTDAEIADQIAADPDTAPDMAGARGWRRVANPPIPDVKAIRRRLGLSQAQFATRFGFSVRTVQQWEQGRAIPDRPARILLKVIERAPETVERVLSGS